jgi:hypothetical protein
MIILPKVRVRIFRSARFHGLLHDWSTRVVWSLMTDCFQDSARLWTHDNHNNDHNNDHNNALTTIQDAPLPKTPGCARAKLKAVKSTHEICMVKLDGLKEQTHAIQEGNKVNQGQVARSQDGVDKQTIVCKSALKTQTPTFAWFTATCA